MLAVRDLEVSYGPIRAVRGISFSVEAGEIVTLIGANGAGKTTTVRAVVGLMPFRGEVTFDGRRLAPNGVERNVRDGLALVPEGRGILGRMTVEENLQIGTYARPDGAAAATAIGRMMERFPILGQRRSSPASLLSGGEQQMLSIARALLGRPRLLLLDEPTLGLAPKMGAFVFDLIGELRREGLTVLLVEQKARQALRIADRAYVMETGRIVAEGRAADLSQDPGLSDMFLGGGAGALRAPPTAG